jgi:hypothetical protein
VPYQQQMPPIQFGTSAAPSWADVNGKIFVAWKGQGSDTRLFSNQSTSATPNPNSGQYTFGGGTQVGGGSSTSPAIANFKGTPYLGWKGESDTSIWWSKFDGTNWATQQQVTIEGAPQPTTDVAPALISDGTSLYLFWKEASSTPIWWAKSSDGQTWENPRLASGGTSDSPALASDGSVLYLAWKGESDTLIWWSKFDGTNWATQQQIATGGTDAAPALAVDGNHAVWLAWKDAAGSDIYYEYLTDEAKNQWSGPTLRPGGTSAGPALVSTGEYAAGVMLAWKGEGTDPGIYYGSLTQPFGVATPTMIQCKLNGSFNVGNVIDIQGNSTQPDALLDAWPPKAGQSLGNPSPLAANQTWEILHDPAGSENFIIQNPETGHCIDIQENSIEAGALLDANKVKTSDNQNQLWDFLPDPFGSGYFFIQNPQTGYVIEIEGGSSESGTRLVVNPRRLFGNNFQLWAGVGQNLVPTTFPALTLAQPNAVLRDTAQYVLQPIDQTKNLTGITVSLDIIEDLVADSFSVQINGNPPYPNPPGISWDTDWMQFGLVMLNNSLVLFNQLWPSRPGHPAGLPSIMAYSDSTLLTLENNTVPAGTRIVLTLTTDVNDYVTGVSGEAYDKSGSPIGTKVNWSAIGRPTWHGGPLQESNLAPLGAFQVVVVGPPSGHTNFTSGMGTITVTCTPALSATLSWPDPTDSGTGETSNCYYGKVQEGYFHQIAQPFGLPSPRITGVTGDYTIAGTGLLPSSNLTVKAIFESEAGATSGANVSPSPLTSQNDGSFSFTVDPQDPQFEYNLGTLSATVTDANGNWASGSVPTGVPSPQVTSTGGLGQ